MSSARAEVLDAARRLFLARGYSDVSVRDIAEEAGVSASLVMKYGGSKLAIFRAVAELEREPARFDVPLPELGRHLVTRVLSAQREGRPSRLTRVVVLLVGAPDPDELRDAVRRQYLQPLVATLVEAGASDEQAAERAEMAMALVVGLATSLRPLRLFADPAGDGRLVEAYGALVQAALEGRTPDSHTT